MNVTVSESAGFCPGVRRADSEVKKLISENGGKGKIYTLGSLIHNRLYNEELKKLGVISVNFDDVGELVKDTNESVTLVIRTHGIPKE